MIRWCPRGEQRKAASIVAKMAAGKSAGGKTQRHAAAPRGGAARRRASRDAHFATTASGGGEQPHAEDDRAARSNGAMILRPLLLLRFRRRAVSEGEGASTFELLECGGIEALRAFFRGADLPSGDAWGEAAAARISAFVARAAADLPQNALGDLVERLLDALAVTESLPMRLSAGKATAADCDRSRRGGARRRERRPRRSRGRSSFGSAARRTTRGIEGLRVKHHPRRAISNPQRHRRFFVPRVHRPAGRRAEDAGSGSGAAEGGGVARRGEAPRLDETDAEDAKTEGKRRTEEVAVDEDEMIAGRKMEDEDDEMHPPDEVEDVSPATNGGGSAPRPSTAGVGGVVRSAPPRAAAHAAAASLQRRRRGTVSPDNDRPAGCARRLSPPPETPAKSEDGARQAQHGVSVGTHARAPVRGHAEGESHSPPASRSRREPAAAEDASDAEEALAAFGPADRRAALSGMLPRSAGSCAATPLLQDSRTRRVPSSLCSLCSHVLRVVTASPARVMALGAADAEEASTRALGACPRRRLSARSSPGSSRVSSATRCRCAAGASPRGAWRSRGRVHSCFPFEVRQQLFYCTTFGLARALHRMHGQSQENGAGGGAGSNGRDLRVGRLQRQKVRVSRDKILESAVKVFDMTPTHRMVLEVEFFNEVGTGTGPTLEFYTLLSKELQQRALGAWRDADPRRGRREGPFTRHMVYSRHPFLPERRMTQLRGAPAV